MHKGQRPRLLTRRSFAASALAAAGLPLASPFIVKARGETPIKVGVLETITGTNGAFGRNEVAGFELARDEINAKGGILGRPVELLLEDAANDVGTGVQKAEKLANRDKVDLMVGDVNSAVAFITGHDSSGLVPDSVDWESLARGAPVLVIYMALKHGAQIAERLMAAGRGAQEPAAVVSKATTAEQSVLETTLGRLAGDVAAAGLEPPAMIVVGQVVRLRAGLDWLGALSGKRLIGDPLGQKRRSETA